METLRIAAQGRICELLQDTEENFASKEKAIVVKKVISIIENELRTTDILGKNNWVFDQRLNWILLNR